MKFVSLKLPGGPFRVEVAHGDAPFRVGVAYGDAPEIAEKAKTHFKSLGAEKVISTEIGSALGVHAGPRALVITIQSLKDGLHG